MRYIDVLQMAVTTENTSMTLNTYVTENTRHTPSLKLVCISNYERIAFFMHPVLASWDILQKAVTTENTSMTLNTYVTENTRHTPSLELVCISNYERIVFYASSFCIMRYITEGSDDWNTSMTLNTYVTENTRHTPSLKSVCISNNRRDMYSFRTPQKKSYFYPVRTNPHPSQYII